VNGETGAGPGSDFGCDRSASPSSCAPCDHDAEARLCAMPPTVGSPGFRSVLGNAWPGLLEDRDQAHPGYLIHHGPGVEPVGGWSSPFSCLSVSVPSLRPKIISRRQSDDLDIAAFSSTDPTRTPTDDCIGSARPYRLHITSPGFSLFAASATPRAAFSRQSRSRKVREKLRFPQQAAFPRFRIRFVSGGRPFFLAKTAPARARRKSGAPARRRTIDPVV